MRDWKIALKEYIENYYSAYLDYENKVAIIGSHGLYANYDNGSRL